MPELQQDFRVLRLHVESPQVSRLGLGEISRVLVHVPALEKEEDVDVRGGGAQNSVVELGSLVILLAVPGFVRTAEEFALGQASRHCANNRA